MRNTNANTGFFRFLNHMLAIGLLTGTGILLSIAEQNGASLDALVFIVGGAFGFGGLAFLLLDDIRKG